MKKIKDIKWLVTAALMAALTFAATSVIKIPTPTQGYIHPGDAVVLLSGFVLGPVLGGLSAGIGSLLADLLGGYAAYAPGTFIIKFLTAYTAACIFSVLGSAKRDIKGKTVIAGAAGETVMTIGYYLYNAAVLVAMGSGAGNSNLSSALAASAAEIPMNLLQGAVGLVLAAILAPVVLRAGDHLFLS